MSRQLRTTAFLFAPLLALAACESPTSGPENSRATPPAISFAIGDVIARPTADAQGLGERFIVCKTGPDATFDVYEVDPSPGFLRTITVKDGECVVAAGGSFTTRTIEVTENVPAGVELVSVYKTQVHCGLGSTHCAPMSITGPDLVSNPVSGYFSGTQGTAGLSGVLADFTNRLIPVVELDGRFTGGGSFFLGNTRFTHGFELRCDATDHRQNLEINWEGNRFHLTQLTSAVCTDDPAIAPRPPRAGLDTYDGTGVGRLNGVDGATITFKITDAGEPGRNDTMTISITPPAGHPLAPGPIAVSNNLHRGNHQAHESTP